MCRSRLALVAALVLLLLAGRAGAQVVEGSLTTLLAGRADPRDGNLYTVIPLYQGLRLTMRDLPLGRFGDLRLEVTGWGMGQFGDPRDGRLGQGDLDVAYLQGRFFKRRLEVRLGRQLVTGGVTRFTHLDGASVALRFASGVGVSAYGGVPAVPRFGVTVGEAVGGGRVSLRFSYESEVGLSYLYLQDKGRAAREDIGLDARMVPHRSVVLSGFFAYSLLELRTAELDVQLSWTPLRWLYARFDYRHQAPDLFISRASIFSVFAMTERDEVGGAIDAKFYGRRILFAGDYHTILEPNGTGHRAGARLSMRLGPAGQLLLGAEERLLLLPIKGYYQSRLFARVSILPTLVASLDLDAYRFTHPVNDRDFSFTSALSLSWDFARAWSGVATGAYTTTPFVENGYEFIVRVAYSPTYRFREKH